MALGTRKGSYCDVYGRAQARGEEDLPEGKYWISACDVYGGVSGPLTAYCGDLPAAGSVSGGGVKVSLCVTRAAWDGSLTKVPS